MGRRRFMMNVRVRGIRKGVCEGGGDGIEFAIYHYIYSRSV